MSEEYVLENPTTSTDVWGRLERAEARVKELEEALRFYDGLSPDEMEDDRDEAGEYGFTARRVLRGEE
jgi:hypothetical protein